MGMSITILLGIFLLVLIAASVLLYLRYNNMQDKYDSMEKDKVNYESIIDQANDAMLVIDIVDGRIHQSNPSAGQMLGYTQQQLEKLSLFNLHPREYLEQSSQVVADVWEKGGLIYKDIPFVTATGELLPVECSAKVAPFAGRPAIVIYARDIRERLRMEREIQHKNEIIEEKNKDILNSIEYAKLIQKSILPDQEEFKKVFPESFILFKPKDIVSGDFYWFVHKEDEVMVAAADCTGHGVPGALMSMIGNSSLNTIVNERKVTRPSEILDQLRTSIINMLKRRSDGTESRDGMDIALCNINLVSNRFQFSGAFNSLWFIRNKELKEVTADKFPIGKYEGNETTAFTNHAFDLQSGDTFYMFTDGYADQFGGPKGKKFKYKKLQELILSLQDTNMADQKKELSRVLVEWQGDLEQLDDILIIGIRIK